MRKRPPRDPPTYFLDECFCSAAVRSALAKAGAKFIELSKRFDRDAPDTVWLPVVGREGWVLLTTDKAQRRVPLERDTIVGSGVAAFYLPVGKRTGDELAALLVSLLEKVERFWHRHEPPFIIRITPAGDFVPHGPLVRRGAVRRDAIPADTVGATDAIGSEPAETTPCSVEDAQQELPEVSPPGKVE